MDDYISRAHVQQFIEQGLNNPDKKKAFGHDAIEILTEVTYMDAADVRPVVRCGECIRKDICRSSNIWAVSPDDNWFCADGERREGGADG